MQAKADRLSLSCPVLWVVQSNARVSCLFEVTWWNIDWLDQPQTNFHVTLSEPLCSTKSFTLCSGNQSVMRNLILDVPPNCNYQLPLPHTLLCISFNRNPHWGKFTLSICLSSQISFKVFIFCVCVQKPWQHVARRIVCRFSPAVYCLSLNISYVSMIRLYRDNIREVLSLLP